MRAGARVAPGAGRPILDREGAEAAQLDPVAARHRGDDLVEDRVDDVLDVALIEMRIGRRNMLYQFGLDHRTCPLQSTPNWMCRISSPSKGAKAPPDRQD